MRRICSCILLIVAELAHVAGDDAVNPYEAAGDATQALSLRVLDDHLMGPSSGRAHRPRARAG